VGSEGHDRSIASRLPFAWPRYTELSEATRQICIDLAPVSSLDCSEKRTIVDSVFEGELRESFRREASPNKRFIPLSE